jgi:4'-phosphopantetheinyl transferase
MKDEIDRVRDKEDFWQPPPFYPVLADGEVHIWQAQLDRSPAEVQRLAKTLASEEMERAGKQYFAQGRNRTIVARGILRALLGDYLACAPGEIEFDYGSYGKPTLGYPYCPNLYFNLSHSDGLALYAFAYGYELGIDVERIRPMEDAAGIVERFFAPGEKEVYRVLPPDAQLEAFFNGWTRKEALTKATGEGLTLSLTDFEVSLAPGDPARLIRSNFAVKWSLHNLSPGSDFVAALAINADNVKLRGWNWDAQFRLMRRAA